ncbi:4-(cytidine 5'-diphospho)-2-C-methyl-D-erythritol kinase [Candidatus Bandiella numerosa]|uniref:4-(cytidine 5'-diphospho)-2-C-methyl-D-erythritol kinase n=1 Tax=Candidatus Bandiella numerosa TaxID=2570586 RepID=UPI00249DE130|nr:4-(cytidine 5'-diphospho)-2-C-methyl-D-erythritol kinase [Candidatus Bandiella numerosa]WHA05150.1 4-(cytidine 5'-diphospho)-2-C-methyl-D-erythritol kinase [Candidatus Bandiella numerosa]
MIYTARSHAKVNLFLNVIDRNANGYHNIQSYFVLLSLSDFITIDSSVDISSCSFENCKLIENNIVIKVLNYINTINDSLKFAKIHIKKNIPIAAGLGGGSSNAAVILNLMSKIWNFPELTAKQISEVAHNIGADVPFFYYGKNAFIEGIGDKITPININKKLFILLINPGLAVETKEIYSCVKGDFTPKISCNKDDIIYEIFHGKNDLEKYAIQKHPLIGELLKIIKKQNNCLVGRMSGSGSTCFGIFEQEEDVKVAMNKLKEIFKNFWIHYEKIYI